MRTANKIPTNGLMTLKNGESSKPGTYVAKTGKRVKKMVKLRAHGVGRQNEALGHRTKGGRGDSASP